jgi:hypothetical protein
MTSKGKDTFDIYQLKKDLTREYGFESIENLEKRGLKVHSDNYEFIYSNILEKGIELEDIYRTFNINIPPDFKGHSLSVSDILVINTGDNRFAYYVDSFGFKEVPEFIRDINKDNNRKSIIDEIKENKKAPKLIDNKSKRNNSIFER